MKRIISVLLVICCLLFSGCTASPDSAVSAGKENISIGNLYQNSYSVEEYSQFLDKWINQPEKFRFWSKLPENFVHLDNIPSFGMFHGFYPRDNFPVWYKYTFSDAEGDDVYLEITHVTNSNSVSTSEYVLATVTPDMTSMYRKPESENRTVIVRNGMEYYYNANGWLGDIIWYNDGVKFQLYGHLSRFDVPEGCFDVYRLLSIDEAEASAAFEEIKQSLNAK